MRSRNGSGRRHAAPELALGKAALFAGTLLGSGGGACGSSNDSPDSSQSGGGEAGSADTGSADTGSENTASGTDDGGTQGTAGDPTGAMADTSGQDTGSTTDPGDACAAFCGNDVACNADIDWTEAECTEFCLDDLAEGPECAEHFVELWACVGALDCAAYLEWQSGPPELRHACQDEEMAIDSCEGGGGKSGPSPR
jgi:hypothetical protein